jgi:hypothetical protein
MANPLAALFTACFPTIAYLLMVGNFTIHPPGSFLNI